MKITMTWYEFQDLLGSTPIGNYAESYQMAMRNRRERAIHKLKQMRVEPTTQIVYDDTDTSYEGLTKTITANIARMEGF